MAFLTRAQYRTTWFGLGFAASLGLTLFFQLGCKSPPPTPTAQVRPQHPDPAPAIARLMAELQPKEPDAAAAASPRPSPAPLSARGCAANQVPIPGGTFMIGEPAREVTLSPYCIDKTEVTVAAFRACVRAHKCQPPSATVDWKGIKPEEKAKWSQFCTWGQRGLDKHPINCVDWNQATAYCESTGGRLPTGAEWEHAARGDDGRDYPWGNQPPDSSRLNACGSECASMAKQRFDETWNSMYKGDDGWAATAPVGSYPKGASPFGVLDMAGNVWEWTADIFSEDGPDSVPHPQRPPSDAPPRALRGGGWNSNAPGRVQPAYPDGNEPGGRNLALGFRCVREAKM